MSLKGIKSAKKKITAVVTAEEVEQIAVQPEVQKVQRIQKAHNVPNGLGVDEGIQLRKGGPKEIVKEPEAEAEPELNPNENYGKLHGSKVQIANYKGKPVYKFEDLPIDSTLLNGIYALEWETPSPIQTKGIMPVIDGRDVLCQAQAGTGKTGTFLIPALNNIDVSKNECQVLIISHARELAEQTYAVASKLSKFTEIKQALHIGGYNIDKKKQFEYQSNCEIVDGFRDCNPFCEHLVIATPGKLKKLISSSNLDVSTVKLVIIDEADKMLTQGFMGSIIAIFAAIGDAKVQVALYSATLSDEVKELTLKFMTNPVTILVKPEDVSMSNIIQCMVCVENEEKKYDALLKLYKMTTHGQTIIFANRKFKVIWLYDKLKEAGFPVCTIHGDMEQHDRDQIMEDYRKNKYRILVGTDVVARGIDIRSIALVINFDVPLNCADYIHRIGRAGRFGTSGCAINIITQDENQLMRKIIQYYKINMHDIKKFHEIVRSVDI